MGYSGMTPPLPRGVPEPGFATDTRSIDHHDRKIVGAHSLNDVPSVVEGGITVILSNASLVDGIKRIHLDGTEKSPAIIVSERASVISSKRDAKLEIYGQYGILEGVFFDGCGVQWGDRSHHLAVRRCTIKNHNGVGIKMASAYAGEDRAHHIAICENEIRDLGDWTGKNGVYDEDFHGVNPVTTHDFWVLGNKIYRVSGDGIQASHAGRDGLLYNGWIGRNVTHHCKQAGVWVKYGKNITVFENLACEHHPILVNGRPSSPGAAFGAQFEHDGIKFIDNTAYNCDFGALLGDSKGGEVQFIGNRFHNIGPLADDGGRSKLDPGHPGYAIYIRGGQKVSVFGNAAYNCRGGISVSEISALPGRAVLVRDNYISEVDDLFALSFVASEQTIANSDMRHNAIPQGDVRFGGYNSKTSLDLFKESDQGYGCHAIEVA